METRGQNRWSKETERWIANKDFVYPRRYSNRMYISSIIMFFTLPVYSFYLGLYDLTIVTGLIGFWSQQYWQHPHFGSYRTIDVTHVLLGTLYSLYIGYNELDAFNFQCQIFADILCVICYILARIFYTCIKNYNIASMFHVGMHCIFIPQCMWYFNKIYQVRVVPQTIYNP